MSDYHNFQCYESLLIDWPKCTLCIMIAKRDPICSPNLNHGEDYVKSYLHFCAIKWNTAWAVRTWAEILDPGVDAARHVEKAHIRFMQVTKPIARAAFKGSGLLWLMLHPAGPFGNEVFLIDGLHHKFQQFSAERTHNSTVIWVWCSNWWTGFSCKVAHGFVMYKGYPQAMGE